jgi:cephalosporin-C deacetylase
MKPLTPASPPIIDAMMLPVVQTPDALLTITADAPSHLYPLNSSARLRIHFHLTPYPTTGVVAKVKIGPEQLEGPEREMLVPIDGLELSVPPQPQPGFIRCTVTATIAGNSVCAFATIGFAPDAIAPTQTEPTDFDAFWESQKAALAQIPIDLQITPAPALSTARVQVSYISFQNVGNWEGPGRFHGVLATPTRSGSFPALMVLPGAGVRPYSGQIELAERGFITLEMGIHGIPVNLPPALYSDLEHGALKDYPRYELDDRNNYYYRRVYLGVFRASEVLAAQPQWNQKTLLVAGGSQGGQLSIVAAVLNPRITGVAANYPAYSDVSGYLHGRAGGWPGLFRSGSDGQPADAPVEPKLLTTRYYDTVNFARRLKVPGHYSWGFNDMATPPTSLHSAYNVITAPKQLLLAPSQEHEMSAEQTESMNTWLLQQAGLS